MIVWEYGPWLACTLNFGRQFTCAWIDGSQLTTSWNCNRFISLDGNIFICNGSNGLQLATTWKNVGSILDVRGLETLHNIASCGKIELPCPPNAPAQWQN